VPRPWFFRARTDRPDGGSEAGSTELIVDLFGYFSPE
jgi:hypothetical protein